MTAVVTGAAGGIGRVLCRRLGEEGHLVGAVDLSPRLGDVIVGLEKLGLRAIAIEADLVTADGLSSVVEAVRRMGGASVLVNNAGITRDSRLINMSSEDFTRVLEVNLGAAYRLTRALIQVMTPTPASIINISSRAYLGNFGQFNYSMSKGGLVGMTRSLALALAPDIRVNAIAPGLIGTEMAGTIPEDVLTKMINAIPMARMGEPEEVAELVAFLASERSSYITGEVIVIGGGRSLSR